MANDEPQTILPNDVREHLVEYVAAATGCTNPTDVWFAWLGFREGRVAWVEDGKRRRLTITGDDADALRFVETGENPAAPPLLGLVVCDRHFPRKVAGCLDCEPWRR